MFRSIIILAVLLATSLSACGGASSDSSLTGTWKSDSPQMVAHISNNQIQIDMVADGSSALYWKGTLPSSVSSGSTVISVGDTAAMEDSLLGSQYASKKFVYKDGKLTFPFSILGMTSTVKLEK